MNIILNICKTELLENSLFYQCSNARCPNLTQYFIGILNLKLIFKKMEKCTVLFTWSITMVAISIYVATDFNHNEI